MNLHALLDTIAWAEIGVPLLARSDNGYNVLVGGKLFSSYADHPRILVDLPRLGIKSSAAGRYQLLGRYFDFYKKILKLADFSPPAQDRIAIQQIKECLVTEQTDIAIAIPRLSRIWASFPGNNYGQHQHSLDELVAVYEARNAR